LSTPVTPQTRTAPVVPEEDVIQMVPVDRFRLERIPAGDVVADDFGGVIPTSASSVPTRTDTSVQVANTSIRMDASVRAEVPGHGRSSVRRSDYVTEGADPAVVPTSFQAMVPEPDSGPDRSGTEYG
ncbi:MAG: hypothetical protein Q4C47_08975, partial [Planctomycetia bacterium]|nr:hypothetical protein [Planctomycetia bacterium]